MLGISFSICSYDKEGRLACCRACSIVMATKLPEVSRSIYKLSPIPYNPQQFSGSAVGLPAHKFQVRSPVFITPENGQRTYHSLSDMMRVFSHNNTSHRRHAQNLPDSKKCQLELSNVSPDSKVMCLQISNLLLGEGKALRTEGKGGQPPSYPCLAYKNNAIVVI